MLTVEHIRAFRRGKDITLTPLWGLSPAQAILLLDDLVAVAVEHHGRTRGELVAALNDVVVEEKLQRAVRGASKLILDQCDFAERDDIDPPALRDALYRRAAAVRRDPTLTFDKDAVVVEVAAVAGLEVDVFLAGLYADLDEARLVDAAALRDTSGAVLLPIWERAEQQALLLRAAKVVIEVEARPGELRALLRTMKLFQLLFEVEPLTDKEGEPVGVRLVVDGPMSLFSSSLRYGMKLALLLPKVLACRVHRLQAEVVLKKGNAPARYSLSGKHSADVSSDDDTTLSPTVKALLDDLPGKLAGVLLGAKVELSSDVLAVAGVGACVPDLVITLKKGKRRLYVEVLGFWSRDAVFKRIELVKAAPTRMPVLFCISDRLRVSEDALQSEHAALLTFKGTLSAKKVAERLQELAG